LTVRAQNLLYFLNYSDGDGSITEKELGEVMKRMGHNPTPKELSNMIKTVDTDGDGKVRHA